MKQKVGEGHLPFETLLSTKQVVVPSRVFPWTVLKSRVCINTSLTSSTPYKNRLNLKVCNTSRQEFGTSSVGLSRRVTYKIQTEHLILL